MPHSESALPKPDFVRIALHHDATRDDVDDAAHTCGWLLVQIVDATSEHPGQAIYLTKDRTGILYYVEDGQIDASYFVVRGLHLERTCEEVRSNVRTLSRSELLAMASTGLDDEATRALLLLAIVTQERDDEVLATLERSIGHESPRVRNAAALARRTLGQEPIGDEPGDLA